MSSAPGVRRTVLAADIGGTHARLALYRGDGGGTPRPVTRRDYATEAHGELAEPLRDFLGRVEEEGHRPEAACLAVACPVTGGRCRLPNAGWEVDAGRLATALELPGLRLVNDFVAAGHAVPHLEEDETAVLQAGRPDRAGPAVLIGAGTGLGQAILLPGTGAPRVLASEGGHADFAPRGPLEERLLAHLRELHGHVSWERVVSGPGLWATYRFLRGERVAPESPELARRLGEAEDPPRLVSRAGLDGDPLARRALDLFVAAFGAEAGNLALKARATGGVYVAGGIAPEILPRLKEGPFLASFRDKGRMRDLMERIPLRVVLAGDAGLRGAAALALRSIPA